MSEGIHIDGWVSKNRLVRNSVFYFIIYIYIYFFIAQGSCNLEMF